MPIYFQYLSKPCFFPISFIKICLFLTQETIKVLVFIKPLSLTLTIARYWYYTNSSHFWNLLWISLFHYFSYRVNLCHSLHWLQINLKLKFNVLWYAFQTLPNCFTDNISDLIQNYFLNCTLTLNNLFPLHLYISIHRNFIEQLNLSGILNLIFN